MKSSIKRSRLAAVADRLREIFGVPQRKRKLPDPLELLVATILSQNTNDINSHKAFTNLKRAFPNFLGLADSRPAKLEPLIKVGGIANKKSKTIVQVVREVRKDFKIFDRRSLKRIRRDDLISTLRNLNGVGYKTASCVSLFALGDDDAFPVDTHVHRILNRIGVVREKTPDKTYLNIKDSIPPRRGYEIHLNLIKFGRRTCTAQNPTCYDCPVSDLCRWKGKSVYLHPDRNEKKSKARSEVSSRRQKKVEFMLLEEV